MSEESDIVQSRFCIINAGTLSPLRQKPKKPRRYRKVGILMLLAVILAVSSVVAATLLLRVPMTGYVVTHSIELRDDTNQVITTIAWGNFEQGEQKIKNNWKLYNSGSEAETVYWSASVTAGWTLILKDGGGTVWAEGEVYPITINPGAQYPISIELTAPMSPGSTFSTDLDFSTL